VQAAQFGEAGRLREAGSDGGGREADQRLDTHHTPDALEAAGDQPGGVRRDL